MSVNSRVFWGIFVIAAGSAFAHRLRARGDAGWNEPGRAEHVALWSVQPAVLLGAGFALGVTTAMVFASTSMHDITDWLWIPQTTDVNNRKLVVEKDLCRE